MKTSTFNSLRSVDSGRAQPHSTTLTRSSKAYRNSARSWSAAVLCRFRTKWLSRLFCCLPSANQFRQHRLKYFFQPLRDTRIARVVGMNGVRHVDRLEGEPFEHVGHVE